MQDFYSLQCGVIAFTEGLVNCGFYFHKFGDNLSLNMTSGNEFFCDKV